MVPEQVCGKAASHTWWVGHAFSGIRGICGVWSVALWIIGKKMSNNILPPFMTIFFVVIGLLLFVFGLMSEILMKTYYGIHVDSPYSIKEICVQEISEKE